MLTVQARITRRARLYFSAATEQRMRSLGTGSAGVVTRRIESATNAQDAPAKALAVHTSKSGSSFGYAIQKERKFGSNKRNWVATGLLMSQLGVTKVTSNSVEIGWTDAALQKRVVILQTIDQMFGYSPKDLQAIRQLREQSGIGRAWFRQTA